MAKKKDWQKSARQPPRLHGWLWWTAFLVLVAGGIIAYAFSLETGQQAQVYMRLSITISVIIAGICVISALSDRFF